MKDRNLVTSRSPSDIPVFNRQMIDLFAAGQRDGHQRSRPGGPASGKWDSYVGGRPIVSQAKNEVEMGMSRGW